jgi:hypothetical protein
MTLICILSQLVVFRKLTFKRLPFYFNSIRFAHPRFKAEGVQKY